MWSVAALMLIYVYSSLRARTDEIFRQIPKTQGLTKQDYLDCDCDWLMWRLLFRRLDYLRLHFLIERLAVERGHQSKQALVDVSREILDLTVLLWLSRDRSSSRLYNYGYIVSDEYHKSSLVLDQIVQC
jgi:hypothetical protein